MFAQWFKKLLGVRTPDEEYQAGRLYAAGRIADASNLTETVEELWEKSDTARTFGGEGHFDRGIADVLSEQGYYHPEHPLFYTE